MKRYIEERIMIDTTKININELHPAEYNPRIMKPSAQLKLKRGIQTFGLIDPIIIDLTDNNTIIGGHQRYNALQEIDNNMNLTLIPLGDIGLVIQDTNLKIKDKNDQKAMNISLNNQNLMGDWDTQKLEEILYELKEEDYRIELTGFDTADLTEEDYEGLDTYYSDEDEYDDEITEASEEPYTPLKEVDVIVKEGDKYKLGNHTLLCADSSDMENIKHLIGDEKIDLILTDAPYGIDIVNTKEREREKNQEIGELWESQHPPDFREW